MRKYIVTAFIWMALCLPLCGADSTLSLRDNLSRGNPGDFIVAAQNKAYTLLLIKTKTPEALTIEEITVPASRIVRQNFSWRDWVSKGAPYHTSWVLYSVELGNGRMRESYALSQNSWYQTAMPESFLPTLLNLRFTLVSDKERKKVGDPLSEGGTGGRKLWQPPMVVDGKVIPGVAFNVWRTTWPHDNSPLADKIIEVYLPQDSAKYPSYFPYWMQAAGVVGKADLRVIDSGVGLKSPAPIAPNQLKLKEQKI